MIGRVARLLTNSARAVLPPAGRCPSRSAHLRDLSPKVRKSERAERDAHTQLAGEASPPIHPRTRWTVSPPLDPHRSAVQRKVSVNGPIERSMTNVYLKLKIVDNWKLIKPIMWLGHFSAASAQFKWNGSNARLKLT